MAEPGLQQRLGLFDGTMLVAGSMIGSGIFIVSADIARDVGGAGWLLLAWVVTGVMTMLGALAYAELAAMMPKAGGQYVYLRGAWGPLAGFLYGWTSVTVIQAGTIAAVGVAFSKYLGALVPKLGTGDEALIATVGPIKLYTGQLIGVGTILLLTWWNSRGLDAGKLVQNGFTVAKLAALAGVIGLGYLFAFHTTTFQANLADPWGPIRETGAFAAAHEFAPMHLAAWMALGGALVGSLFSSDAWNNVTFTAGEMRQPQRNLPLSLILGTGTVTLLYLLANAIYLGCLPINGVKDAHDPISRGIAHAADDRVATAVMELVSPQSGVRLMALAIMVSTFGCNNGLILAGARLTYAMARDGLFFASAGKLNRNGVPAVALWVQAIWSSVLVFTGRYNDLLEYVIFAALLFYALTVAGLFALRIRQPNADRPYRALGYPILPALYIALCVLVMLDLLYVKPLYTWPGLVIVLLGVPVYYLWNLSRPQTSS